MKKTIIKEFFREIWKTKNRFLSIMAIVALGAGFFAGINVTTTDMKLSAANYYRNYHLSDFHLMSTYGITDDDVESLLSQSDTLQVDTVMTGYSKDVIVNPGTKQEATVKILSYSGDDQTLNQYKLLEGRMPETINECVVDTSNKVPKNFALGETLTVATGAKDDDLSDTLATDTFTVVGIVQTPTYINFSRGYTTIGNGTLTGFLVVPEEAFVLDVYTDLYLTTTGSGDLDPFGDAYPALIEERTTPLTDFAESRGKIRYDEIVSEAQEKLDDAKSQLADGEQEQQESLAKARQELSDGEAALADGKDQLAEGKAQLEESRTQLADAEAEGSQQLSDARTQLETSAQTLSEQESQYQSAKAQFDESYPTAVAELESAAAQLAEGRTALETQLAQGQAQLDAAKAELDSAKAQLDDGYEELSANRTAFETQIAEKESQLDDTKAQLDSAKAQLDDGDTAIEAATAALEEQQAALDSQKAALEATASQMPAEQLAAAMAQLSAGQSAIDESRTQLAAQKEQLESSKAEYEAGFARYEAGVAQLANAKAEGEAQLTAAESQLAAAQAEYDDGLAQYEAGVSQLADAKAEGQAKLDAAETEIAQGQAQLTESQNQLVSAATAIEEGKAQLEEGYSQLAEQEASFQKQIADGQAQITEGEAQLLASEQELLEAEQTLQDGYAEYDKSKKESDQQLQEARDEIAENEAALNDLEEPEWYVFTRDDNVGYSDYSTDTERLKNVSAVLPVFFILIAVLVCLTTMTRMVEERRTQIGTLKALGYGKGAIMAKYLLYAIFATILGCAVGLSVGFVLFPSVLFLAYSTAYNIPDHIMPFHWNMALLCTAVGIVCIVTATLFACYKELYAEPATLMRPKAPPAGKKILLERWTSLWKRIPFAMKLTLRNLLRYKKRAIMTIVGIGGCTALMLTGFGMQYGIQSIVDKQFDTIMIYDGVVALKDNLTDDEKQEAFQAIDDLDGVTDQMFVKMSNVDVSQNDTTMSASLLVPEQSDDFDQYMDLHTRSDKTEISLTDSGVVLSEKLARNCGVSAGDTVEITPNNVEKTVPVLGVNENYAGNYVYMTTDLFTETFGDIGYNCILINTKGDDYQNDISTAITENELFAGSSFNKDTADNFRNIIRNLNSVVIVIIISAGALAFIVLYNLVNINVGERIRELATLKVLGYRDHETSSYIYRENIICTIIGILLGLIGGIFLERFVIRTAEVEAAMFSPEIPFYCFVFAGLLTLAFTLVVNVALHFKLKKLDMVESLKSVD